MRKFFKKDQIQLREIKLTDVEAFVQFRAESARETEYVNPITRSDARATIEKVLKTDTEFGFVLEENTQLLGQLFLEAFPERKRLKIRLISILQDHVRQGLGSRLMNKAIVVADELNLDELELIVHKDNTHAIEFYEKLGFELEKRIGLWKLQYIYKL